MGKSFWSGYFNSRTGPSVIGLIVIAAAAIFIVPKLLQAKSGAVGEQGGSAGKMAVFMTFLPYIVILVLIIVGIILVKNFISNLKVPSLIPS